MGRPDHYWVVEEDVQYPSCPIIRPIYLSISHFFDRDLLFFDRSTDGGWHSIITIINTLSIWVIEFTNRNCFEYRNDLGKQTRKRHIMHRFAPTFVCKTVGLGTRHPALREQLRTKVQVVSPSLISLNYHRPVLRNHIIHTSQFWLFTTRAKSSAANTALKLHAGSPSD
ncbi:hypothetical protein LI328DRAFT_170414 [Trichoderma asperelloides]|nr:hypothetical protein LI328DRAFT_170414 [Trichoderma asperelloides]